VTDRESNPRPLGCMSGDSTTRLKRSAVMSGTYWNPSLIYQDICVERGASYAACAAHNRIPFLLNNIPHADSHGILQNIPKNF